MKMINYTRSVIYEPWAIASLSRNIKTRLLDAVRIQKEFLHLKPRDGIRPSMRGLPNRSGQFEELFEEELT